MRKKQIRLAGSLLAGVFFLVLGPGCVAFSAEHPKEHPEEEEAPAQKSTKKPTMKEFKKAVEAHIKKVEKKGFCAIKDEKENHDRKLKFKRVHEDKLTHLKGDTYFACTDFEETVNGKKIIVDMDFWMDFKNGKWVFKKYLIHKVNGKPRITYKNNEPVPVE